MAKDRDEDDDRRRDRADTTPVVTGSVIELNGRLTATGPANADGTVEVIDAVTLQRAVLPAGTWYKRRKD